MTAIDIWGNTFRTMATTRQQAAARRKSKVQAELYMQHKADAIYNSGTETNWDFEPEEELARASSAMGYSENVPFVQVEEPRQTKSLVLQRSKSYEEPRSKSMVYQPHSNTLNQSPVRAQEETAVRDLFRKSDVNGDGLLSVEELQYGLSDWGFPDVSLCVRTVLLVVPLSGLVYRKSSNSFSLKWIKTVMSV